MDTGKSIRIALIKRDKTQEWLASQIPMTRQGMHIMCSRKSDNTHKLSVIAEMLDMSLIELLQLGE